MIKKQGNGYYIYSKSGKKLEGPFSSKKKAEERLRQIEYFKHKNK